ncbi:hypothetical protein M3P21_09755 [Ruegeria sp. 2012CJ41-6]|uniref:Uncharacterized protein n=1 Tax=Ruegeria spongiae TaxID=2942209 RepID=A0ABT0Q2I4_9RHOB|nr:hypothetical protein [Ruegeria spongiae]MCL6283812.1 hypothetical protein [Ruegeria spongiae]
MLRYVLPFVLIASMASAQDAPRPEPAMTYERLGRIIFALDPEAQPSGPGFQFVIDGMPVLVVTDAQADRMRAIVPIRSANELTAQDLTRMMQANFDSALDARYAIANGTLWAAFIHPLSPLEKNQFISGLGQTVNVARTYGTLYSGGAVQFGGGDSGNLQRQLIDELLKKGEEI